MPIDYPYALSAQRYRALLEQDFTRMRSLLDAAVGKPVPECEGWDGRQVALHTAAVYMHKAAEISSGAEMPFPREALEDVPPGTALDRAWATLVTELDTRSVDDPAHTWWPADQTVGFWLRRMAHETAIHRRDMESAAGELTPVDDQLAVDGIDEALDPFLCWDWEDETAPGATGVSVRVESAEHAWVVTLDPQQAVLDRSGRTPASATIGGDPNAVLLWLWGRRGPRPTSSGHEAALRELRERLSFSMT
jgi:uncharacterized protein (TIGR03083 family)